MFAQTRLSDMSHKLIQVGNSKALVIPARLLRNKGYDSHTEFDIIETADGFKVVRLMPSLDGLVFPKVPKPAISENIKAICKAVSFEPEDINSDERLKYILDR